MTSTRAKLLSRALRTVMKPMRLHEMEPEKLRKWAERRTFPFRAPNVAVSRVDDPAPGEWQRPEAGSDGVILYLHGGGYVFGSPRLYRSMTTALARLANCAVFALDYRLAPEHPCPAAIEDAVAAFQWLIENEVEPSRLVIAGDSAGGGLTLASMVRLRDRKLPLPAGAILLSPWTDLSGSGASMIQNAECDAMFQQASIVEGASRYAGRRSRTDPEVSPLFADLSGLPPLLIFASESEMLYDDAERLAAAARARGVRVQLETEQNLPHVWPMFHPLIPEARVALGQAAGFVRDRIK